MAGKSSLTKSQGEYAKLTPSLQAASGDGKAAASDQDLDEGRHDRSYNPADKAERCSISSKLNEDAGRYKKGPGPM